MASSSSSSTDSSSPFRKVGENLYRLESTGGYYALLKKHGKQIRRSLKTKDRALAKRKLSALRKKVESLDPSHESRRITFEQLAKRWLSVVQGNMKPASAKRLEVCINGLKPFFRQTTIRNLDRQQAMDHSSLPRDLDWIVLKAIDKDRNRRYETANELAMDTLGSHMGNARDPYLVLRAS